ncbi:hypothetical protein [Microvirga antarctica]|uniref:hypothetical protein n=1 Tax=Microvirga antarctica TaxID=2819233 RepID=UPI001B3072E3|nr:hypothetical protein [Microvirga antarctica]
MQKPIETPNSHAGPHSKAEHESAAHHDLDARLDHGIKESFPGSDPVSVKVSKYAPGDPRGVDETSHGDDDRVSGALRSARHAAEATAERIADSVDYLSARGRKVAPRAQRAVADAVTEHPVAAMFLAGLVGCGVALLAYEVATAPRAPRKTRRRAYGADEIS